MWQYPKIFDVIVIGGGHAGCEASYASAKMGMQTLLVSMNLDALAKMSCNPSIGGIAKGHIVREIDALGGIMGEIADKTTIHFKMLNASKGPAVLSPRAQIDKAKYHLEMKKFLENTKNLEIKQVTVESLIIKNGKICGITTQEGFKLLAKSVIITTGTFLKGLIHIGDKTIEAGRSGCGVSNHLSTSFKNYGLELDRLKTGTPARIHKRSIDFTKVEEQPSEKKGKFSFKTFSHPPLEHTSCYITYTTEETKKVILNNLKKSALFSGRIKGIGPRYCPSIEDKITRFADKERHQVFLEPEGLDTEEFYVNGLSTSMPMEVQLKFLQSVIGLENVEITRPAYAIEYDFLKSFQIYATLESKKIENLYFAGQINGTTGYEEAAAQGLIAGINAALKISNKDPFILKRSESYIGVLIDDLISKDLIDPYRMFTSRAEHRLLLRHDNADNRLTKYGYQFGLIDSDQHEKVLYKIKVIDDEKKRLKKVFKTINNKSISLYQYLSRPEIKYSDLVETFSENVQHYSDDINRQLEIEIKFAGYLTRQKTEVEKLKHLENVKIPKNFDFSKIKTLRNEAKEKFQKFSPPTLASASKILGISPADISILLIEFKKQKIAK